MHRVVLSVLSLSALLIIYGLTSGARRWAAFLGIALGPAAVGFHMLSSWLGAQGPPEEVIEEGPPLLEKLDDAVDKGVEGLEELGERFRPN